MYPKEQRVKKEKAIDLLNSSRYSTKTAVLQFKAWKQDVFQVMVVVSKKVAKRANVRNTLRRQILAVMQTHNLDTTLPPAAYQVRIHNKMIVEYTYSEIESEVLDGFTKLCKILTTTAK